MPSYPARGTWIEMVQMAQEYYHNLVVPRTGYVDRNAICLSVKPKS